MSGGLYFMIWFEAGKVEKPPSYMKFYIMACVWICYWSCTPNIHVLVRLCKSEINFFNDALEQMFILTNNVLLILTTLDAARTGFIWIPPIMR